MFRLHFTPNFRSQRHAFLSETTFEIDPLPESVSACLASITVPPVRGAGNSEVGSRMLWRRCLGIHRRLLIRGAAFALLSATAASFSTLAGMAILKSGKTFEVLIGFSAVYFFMNFLSQCSNYQGARIRAWVSLGAESYLAGLISQKILHLSPLAAECQSSGNLQVLITSDTRNVGDFLNNVVRNLIPTIAAFSVISPFLIYFCGKAGALGMAVMLLILPLSLGLNRLNQFLQERRQREMDRLTSLVGEWVKNIRLVRYLSWDEAFQRDVSLQLRNYMKLASVQHLMACLIFGLSSGWWMVAVTGVVVGSALLGTGLELTSFFGALWLLTFLAGFLAHVPNTIRLFGQANPSMKRIARLLSEPEISSLFMEGMSPSAGSLPKQIQFQDVGFRYPGGKQALINFTANFDLSEKLAIVGEIGGGKTTLLKLLCGEYPPTSGEIRIKFDDGRSYPLWQRETHAIYRNALAFVPQEPFVSNDPFSVNIALGADAEDSRIVDAAYFAELETDIAIFPNGIHQEIGESGVNLSGGQKQRLNLARAIFSKRPYLVLDDILSAVDGKTEVQLMRRLQAKEGGFALVTHRTKELRNVNRVFVMKDGKKIEDGEPSVLAADPDSHYARVLRAYERDAER